MKQPKLFQLLSAFSKEELRAFQLFLKSPYFNQSNTLLKLFDIIKKSSPTFDSKNLSKEKIYQNLDQTATYDEKYINDRFSDLSKLVEEFMVIHQVRKDATLKNKALRKSLNLHHLDKLFIKETQKSIAALERKPNHSWQQSLELWNLKYELFTHPVTNKWNTKKDESVEMTQHLDETYLILKLRYGFHQKIRGTIFSKKEKTLFFDTIMNHAKKSKHPVIYFYYLMIMTFEESKLEQKWSKARDYYNKHYTSLPVEDQYAGLLGLVNRGNNLVLSGKSKFHIIILDLYKFGLKEKILLPNGVLSEQTFKNIALLGSGTGNLEWTAKFIEEYSPALPKGHDPNIICLCRAYHAFFSSNFKACITCLEETSRLKTRDKLSYKSLEIRCRYELYANTNLGKSTLEKVIDRYEQFLQGKKSELAKGRVKAYQNFVYLVKSLSKIKHSAIYDQSTEIQKLKKEFSKREACVAKDWVLQKIKEL